jgi:hypothetical protein
MSATLRVSSNANASAASLCYQAGEAKLSMSLPRAMQYEEFTQAVLASMTRDAMASWVAAIGDSPEQKAKACIEFCKQAHEFQAKRAKKAKTNMSELSDDSAKVAAARRLEAGKALQALVPKLADFA